MRRVKAGRSWQLNQHRSRDQSRSLGPAVNRSRPKAEGLLQSDSSDEWLDRPRTALGTKVWEFPAAADRRSMTVLKPVARLLPDVMVVGPLKCEQMGIGWKPVVACQVRMAQTGQKTDSIVTESGRARLSTQMNYRRRKSGSGFSMTGQCVFSTDRVFVP
jgi:hypothetical protein